MAKARKRYFEISPGWGGGGESAGLGIEGWSQSPVLGLTFAVMEKRFRQPYPSSAKFMFKRPKAMPDFVHATGNAPIVTSNFKSVVEAIAPNEAEFRPFSMRWPDDEPVAGEWYLMNVLNLIDCFDFGLMAKPRPVPLTHRPTGEAMTDDEIWLQGRLDQAVQIPPFYINPETVGALHLWRPFFHSYALFCTGELLKALKAAGVKGLHADRLGTRDDPVPVFNRTTGLFELPQFPEPRSSGVNDFCRGGIRS